MTGRTARPVAGRRDAHTRQRRRLLAAGLGTVAVAVLVAVLAAGSADKDETGDNDAAPTASFGMLDGGSGSLADYRRTPMVVNFFASWCVPCLAEMPGFEQVHQDLDGQVAFLGINLQDDPADGRAVVEQTGITYPVAVDPDGTLFTAFGGFAMPTTVFIDADGQVVELHSGEITAQALADKIDTVLLG